MPIKGWVEVNNLFCKGCEICLSVCPQHVLTINTDYLTAKGYHPVQLSGEGCTGCAVCALVCPDAALTIYRATPVRPRRKRPSYEVN